MGCLVLPFLIQTHLPGFAGTSLLALAHHHNRDQDQSQDADSAMSIDGDSAEDASQDESRLRDSLRRNPKDAAACAALAESLLAHNQRLDEAQTLIQRGILLDVSNFHYRIVNADLLTARKEYETAEIVLDGAGKVAHSPEETAILASRKDHLAALLQASGGDQTGVSTTTVTVINVPARHPEEPPTGVKHTVTGTLSAVECSFPTYLELKVAPVPRAGSKAAPKEKPVHLYIPNFAKIDLSALGFTPPADMNPCRDINGMKARVVYAESSDKSIDGQIVSIELHR